MEPVVLKDADPFGRQIHINENSHPTGMVISCSSDRHAA